MLVNDGTNSDASHWIIVPVTPTTPNYALEAEVQVVRTEDSGCRVGFGSVARASVSGAYHSGVYYEGGSPNARIRRTTDDICTDLAHQDFDPGIASIPSPAWHTYRMEVQGNVITLKIDGNTVLTTTDSTFSSAGQVGLWSNAVQIDVRRFEVLAL